MDAANPFAQMPDAPEPIIALVQRDLTRQEATTANATQDDLDRLAEAAVRELWQSRVRTFVPVLALRQARQVLRERGLPPTEPLPVTPAAKADRRRSEADMFHAQDDVLRVDDDVLRLND